MSFFVLFVCTFFSFDHVSVYGLSSVCQHLRDDGIRYTLNVIVSAARSHVQFCGRPLAVLQMYNCLFWGWLICCGWLVGL